MERNNGTANTREKKKTETKPPRPAFLWDETLNKLAYEVGEIIKQNEILSEKEKDERKS